MNMKNNYFPYDSSEEDEADDEVKFRSMEDFNHVKERMVEDDDFQLKPKMSHAPDSTETITNGSTVLGKAPQRQNSHQQLMSAYTFKLKSSNKRKKTDPVSLFQHTSKMWKQDKFLTSRGNNREGRKLNLDTRNKKHNPVDSYLL